MRTGVAGRPGMAGAGIRAGGVVVVTATGILAITTMTMATTIGSLPGVAGLAAGPVVARAGPGAGARLAAARRPVAGTIAVATAMTGMTATGMMTTGAPGGGHGA